MIVSVVTDPASVVGLDDVVDAGNVQLAVPHPYPEGQQPPPTLAAHPNHPVAQFVGVDAPADPLAELAPVVTVVVTCAARLEISVCALWMAEEGIAAPARLHAHSSGVKRLSVSRSLSQKSCIHVIRSGRKLPADARQRHAMSVAEQLSS